MKSFIKITIACSIVGALIFGAFLLTDANKPDVETATPIRTRILSQLEHQGFRIVGLPKTEAEMVKANHSDKEYCVQYSQGETILDSFITVAETNRCNQYSNELLIGDTLFKADFVDNNLSYGPWLMYCPKQDNCEVLLEQDVVHMLQVSNWLYVFTGHCRGATGGVYKINLNIKPITPERVTRVTILPSSPALIFHDQKEVFFKNQFLIVTSNGLVELIDDEQFQAMDILLHEQYWLGLYPNSAVFQNNQLVLGMRSGIVWLYLDQTNHVIEHYFLTK